MTVQQVTYWYMETLSSPLPFSQTLSFYRPTCCHLWWCEIVSSSSDLDALNCSAARYLSPHRCSRCPKVDELCSLQRIKKEEYGKIYNIYPNIPLFVLGRKPVLFDKIDQTNSTNIIQEK